MAEYVASVQPSLGLNTTFVGGNYALHHGEPRIDTDAGTYGNFCVTRLGRAIKPGSLIVFISARFKTSAGSAPGAQGNFYVLSPRLFSQRWSDKFDPNATSDKFGHVHPRGTRKLSPSTSMAAARSSERRISRICAGGQIKPRSRTIPTGRLKPCKKSEGRRGQNRAKKAQLIVNGNLGILVGLHSKFPR